VSCIKACLIAQPAPAEFIGIDERLCHLSDFIARWFPRRRTMMSLTRRDNAARRH